MTKRLGLLCVLLSIAALAGCSKKSESTAHMPEFYVFAGRPYCLVEMTTSESDAAKRKDDMFNLLPALYVRSEHWSDFGVVGVDYLDFKKLTLLLHTGCTDQTVKQAVEQVEFVNKKFSGKAGGDAKLIATADVVEKNPSPLVRFNLFNPGQQPDQCVLHYKLARGAADRQGRVPNLFGAIAVSYHFPIADLNISNQDLFMLLADHCGERDRIAANIEAALKLQGVETGRDVVRQSDPDVKDYAIAASQRS